MNVVGYLLDEFTPVCISCADGYDTYGLTAISKEDAEEYGDYCAHCSLELAR